MDDEEGDFTLNSTARSRLSSLFQGDSTGGDVNQALTFTAPKQPRKNENPQSTAGAFKLLHAVAVHAYKLKDGNYTNQGKLGCAILGLHESASYKFLLYKGKQIQVTSCSIVPSFKFHVQPNNYVNFYDEKNENWSINFDSEMALTEFAKQVALAKANCEGKSQSSLIIQDLVLGDGPSLETGDSAEVRYTGWALTKYSFGQVFDSNMKSESPFRLRLGKSKIIKGLSEGLVGTQKGSKRLLIIPPNLATEGTSPTVPPNTTVIFEVLVNKVKISRESSHSPSPVKVSENITEKKPEVLPRSSISQEDNIRMRGASISEQLSQSPKKDKAHLISRMAKMGTATLPLPGAVAAQVSSESEDEEEIPSESPPVQFSNSRTSSPKSFTKPRSRKNSGSSLASQTSQVQTVQPQPIQESVPMRVTQHSSQITLHSQATLPTQQQFMTPGTTVPFPAYQSPFQAQFPMHSMPGVMPTSIADTHLPLLITEARNQNTEVRMSLSKITDKVDTVIQKVDDLRFQQGRQPSMSQAPFMDSTMLVQNIERIVQENKQLKDDVENKNAKIQSLNEKICDLFQRNQRFFEESNSMLEQRSDSIHAVSAQSQTKILSLENEKTKLSSDLYEATSKLTTIEAELNKSQNLEAQLKRKLLEYEKEAEMRSSDSNSETEILQLQLKSADKEIGLLTGKLSYLEEQCAKLLESKATLEKLVKENESNIQEIKSKTEKEIKEAYDKEIRQYQEKLKQATTSVSEKDSSSEIEILEKEKERMKKDKEELLSKARDLEKRLKDYETSELMLQRKLQEQQMELESSLLWKKKYEIFYEKTRAMKDRYESQAVELALEIKQLRAARTGNPSSDFSGELKKAMNALYKILQGKFESNSSYTGTKVLELTLQSIRFLTFQMLEMKSRASSSSSEQEAESGKIAGTAPNDEKSNSPEPAAAELKTDNLQSSVENQSKESSPPIQQNGLNDAETKVDASLSISESVETSVDNSSVKDQDDNPGKLETKSVEESAPKGKECDQNGVYSSSGASESNDVPETSKLEESKIQPNDSKSIDNATVINRSSPDIWRPQPPPLFDDDDDDDDEEDDDWLK